MEKFKKGDVVKLKSGGPDMTVKFYHEDQGVSCSWFVNGKLNESYFEEDTLEKVDNTPLMPRLG